jgi:hypothetical protein
MPANKNTHLNDREKLGNNNNGKSTPDSPLSQDALRHQQDAEHHKNQTDPARIGTKISSK